MKTAFVVGAGASCEFGGLKAGDGLKTDIARSLDFKLDDMALRHGGSKILYESIRKLASTESAPDLGWYGGRAANLVHALPASRSIDNFLDSHSEDARTVIVGKLAIAYEILRAERASKLFFKSRLDLVGVQSTWLNSLFGLLVEQCNPANIETRLTETSFIVFNYDRCIEHYMTNALQTHYRMGADQADAIVNGISIVHPYGQVGYLPGMTNHGSPPTAFGAKPAASELLDISKSLKTFTEGVDPTSDSLARIRSIIQTAERIVFLGFAFHPINMKLLNPGAAKSNASSAYATGKGLSVPDARLIKELLKSTIAPHLKNLDIAIGKSCLELFFEYGRSLSFTA